MLNTDEKTREQSLVEQLLDEDVVRAAFREARDTSSPEILETGPLGDKMTYKLTSGTMPKTGELYFEVKVSSVHPERKMESWLHSGVFWTQREAETYVNYLKANNGNLLRS